jgi:hypothetical protein
VTPDTVKLLAALTGSKDPLVVQSAAQTLSNVMLNSKELLRYVVAVTRKGWGKKPVRKHLKQIADRRTDLFASSPTLDKELFSKDDSCFVQ